ncbi:transmembrane protein, putative [Bodo saltans]|uniref:Transmembrane protein, putative n=1 Tax=Bodo saltans TaxID=75058 RepID=A0A0S4IWN5_BODSA|nr:transmembrane protein, putative [Bodo saltans]|eukprot:CUG31391.1 transmembrane protein, putative [Bodo saltans]
MPHEPSVFDTSVEGDDNSQRPTTFDVHTCPSSLPDIRPQELRIIGRVVSFTADLETGGQRRTCAFKGWVGHITKDTVTMIDAIRFEDVAELHDAARTAEIEMEKFPITLHRNSNGPSPVSVPPTALPAPDNGTLAVASGRLPYATFPRRKLRNVKFETDHAVLGPSRSQDVEPFLSPIRCPSWFPHDVQKVRMFVRRYIVHTAQNNNNQRLSLMSFLLTRLALPEGSIDATLLQIYVAEELADLQTVDQEITARNEHTQQHQQQRTDQANERANAAAQRMQSGPAQRLHATGIISRTTYMAIGEFACGIGLLLYSASAFTTINDDFILDFTRPALTLSVITGIVLVAAAVCTALSVVGIVRLPLSGCKICARTFGTLSALAIGATNIASLSREMFLYMKIDGTAIFDFYLDKVANHRSEVCDLFKDYTCSGWARICDSSSSSSVWAKECPSPSCTTSFSTTCQTAVEKEVRSQLLPLFIMTIVGLLFVLFDAYMLCRLRQKVAQIMREPAPAAA